eukprot:3723164-Amphidinium_carterae.1
MYQRWFLIKAWGTEVRRPSRIAVFSHAPHIGGPLGSYHARAKTTGPGKRISELPLYVSQDAWLVKNDWLRTGWVLSMHALFRLAESKLTGPAGLPLQSLLALATFWTEKSELLW